jgi:hypothetical protein
MDKLCEGEAEDSSTRPEHWIARGQEVISFTYGRYARMFEAPDAATARRVAACLKACAGISTDALENGVLESLFSVLRADALGTAATLLDIVEAARAALGELESPSRGW